MKVTDVTSKSLLLALVNCRNKIRSTINIAVLVVATRSLSFDQCVVEEPFLMSNKLLARVYVYNSDD